MNEQIKKILSTEYRNSKFNPKAKRYFLTGKNLEEWDAYNRVLKTAYKAQDYEAVIRLLEKAIVHYNKFYYEGYMLDSNGYFVYNQDNYN